MRMNTNPNYWNCQCEDNFVHSRTEPQCAKCGAISFDSVDSLDDEVNKHIQNPIPAHGSVPDDKILLNRTLSILNKLTKHGLFYGFQIKLDHTLNGLHLQTQIHELIQAIVRNDKSSGQSIPDGLLKLSENVQAVNFIDFCKCATSEQIQLAIKFYNEDWAPEKVPQYFKNWTLKYNDSEHKEGVILTNEHSSGEWKTVITINEGSTYEFDNDGNWQYVPKTFSEFISDVLRYNDFDLIFSEIGLARLSGK